MPHHHDAPPIAHGDLLQAATAAQGVGKAQAAARQACSFHSKLRVSVQADHSGLSQSAHSARRRRPAKTKPKKKSPLSPSSSLSSSYLATATLRTCEQGDAERQSWAWEAKRAAAMATHSRTYLPTPNHREFDKSLLYTHSTPYAARPHSTSMSRNSVILFITLSPSHSLPLNLWHMLALRLSHQPALFPTGVPAHLP